MCSGSCSSSLLFESSIWESNAWFLSFDLIIFVSEPLISSWNDWKLFSEESTLSSWSAEFWPNEMFRPDWAVPMLLPCLFGLLLRMSSSLFPRQQPNIRENIEFPLFWFFFFLISDLVINDLAFWSSIYFLLDILILSGEYDFLILLEALSIVFCYFWFCCWVAPLFLSIFAWSFWLNIWFLDNFVFCILVFEALIVLGLVFYALMRALLLKEEWPKLVSWFGDVCWFELSKLFDSLSFWLIYCLEAEVPNSPYLWLIYMFIFTKCASNLNMIIELRFNFA